MELLKQTSFRLLSLVVCVAAASLQAAEVPTFGKRLAEANRLLDEGKLEAALSAAKGAAQLDTNRFEAPFLATVIFLELKKPEQARLAFDSALALAPSDKKPKLEALRKELEALEKTPSQKAVQPGDTVATHKTPAARRQLDGLMLIIEEADRATLDAERKKLLREFMIKSAEFLESNSMETNVWIIRAAAALELNSWNNGWLAARRLKRLGLFESDEPKIRKIVAMLDRKEWSGERSPSSEKIRPEWMTPVLPPAPNAGKLKWSPEKIQPAAQAGDDEAQRILGNLYMFGSDVPKDEATAVEWFKKSAQSGNTWAQNNLAYSYEKGRGVPQDVALSVEWLSRSAVSGNPTAQLLMGGKFARGDGVSKSEVEAIKWYGMGAEDGYSPECRDRLAWILATSANPIVRDGRQAVNFAQAALKDRESESRLATLAAAYGEVGDFENAVKYAELAIGATKDEKFIQKTKEQLNLYRQGKSYHEPTP